MRKKFIKSMLAMTLALSVTLVGCGNEAQNGSEAKEETKEEAKEEVKEDVQTGGKITFPLEEPATLSVFVYHAGSAGPYADSYPLDWIEEQTNVRLEIVNQVTGEEGKTERNLMMSDPDSIPDILLTNWSKSEAQIYADQGLIIPLNEYLENCENFNKLVEEVPGRIKELTLADGNLYNISNYSACFHCQYDNRMYIYKPWVDKLMDGKMPETTEELYEYLKKVKTEDPNGNGVADEIPMSGHLGGWNCDPSVWIMNSFLPVLNKLTTNAVPDTDAGFIVENGGIVDYQCDDEEFKEGLRYLNKLYTEGLIDNQVFTQDAAQFVAAVEENKVGMYPAGNYQHNVPELNKEPGDYQNWVILEPVAGPEGVRYAAPKATSSYTGNGYVSKNCENPELAVALMDFLGSLEASLVQFYGPEGIRWEWTDEGTSLKGETPVWRVISDYKCKEDGSVDWKYYGYEKEYSAAAWNSSACFGNQPRSLKDDMLIVDPTIELEAILYEGALRYDALSVPVENVLPIMNYNADDAKMISDYSLSIGQYVQQSMVEFITGKVNIDEGWDNYVKQLENMGLADYIDVYQRNYDMYMTTE